MALKIDVNLTEILALKEAVDSVNKSVTLLKGNLNSLPSKNITAINKKLATTNKQLVNVATQSKKTGKAFASGTLAGNENLNSASRAMRKLNTSTMQFTKQMEGLRAFGRRWDYLGSKLLPVSFGLGLITTGAVAVGASFENAFQDVIKTLNAPQVVLDGLRKSIRRMATEIPVSANELSKLASIGAQLGLPADSIINFTDTVSRLGVATDIASEEAGLIVTQFTNVMQASDKLGKKLSKGLYIERVGNTLVQLGNTTSTTESQIMQMSRRLSGVASVMKLTGAETLGWSAAMASLGIQAQQGGSALGRVLLKFNSFVAEGGNGLKELAKVSGMSAKEFQKSWGKDSSRTMQILFQNLSKLSKNKLQNVLTDLGIKNTNDVQVMLKLAKGVETVDNALYQSNKGWTENNALLNESNKRFQTTLNKLKTGLNSFLDVAITVFDKLKPAFDGMIGGLTEWAKNLNQTIKGMDVGKLKAIGIGLLIIAGAAPTLKLVNIALQLLAGSLTTLKKIVDGSKALRTGIPTTIIGKDGRVIGETNVSIAKLGSTIKKLKNTVISGGKLSIPQMLGLGAGGALAVGAGAFAIYKGVKFLYESTHKSSIALAKSLNSISDSLQLSDEGLQSYEILDETLYDILSNIELFNLKASGMEAPDITSNLMSNLPQAREQFDKYIQDIIKSQTKLTQARKYLSAEEINDYTTKVANKYKGQQKEADVIFNNIKKIQQKASAEGRSLTNAEIDKIQKKYKDLENLVLSIDLTPKTPKLDKIDWDFLTPEDQQKAIDTVNKNFQEAMSEVNALRIKGDKESVASANKIQEKSLQDLEKFYIDTGQVTIKGMNAIRALQETGNIMADPGIALNDAETAILKGYQFAEQKSTRFYGDFLTKQSEFITKAKAGYLNLSNGSLIEIQNMYNNMSAEAQKNAGNLNNILQKGIAAGLTGDELSNYIKNSITRISKGLPVLEPKVKINPEETNKAKKDIENTKPVIKTYLEPHQATGNPNFNFSKQAVKDMENYNKVISSYPPAKINKPKMPDGFTLGKNTAEGIEKGISSVDIKAKVKIVANEVTGTYAKYLEISSPSKVTTKQGYFTGIGWSNGILSTISIITNSVQKVGKSVISSGLKINSNFIDSIFGVGFTQVALKKAVKWSKGFVSVITKVLSEAQFQTAVNINQMKITQGILEQMLNDGSLSDKDKKLIQSWLDDVNDEMEMQQDRSQQLANNETQHAKLLNEYKTFYNKIEDRMKKNQDITKKQEDDMAKYLNASQKKKLSSAIDTYNRLNNKKNLTKKEKKDFESAKKVIGSYNQKFLDYRTKLNEQNKMLDDEGINAKFDAMQLSQDWYKELGYDTDYNNGKITITGKTDGGTVNNTNIIQNIEINGTNMTSQELISMLTRYKKVVG